MRYGSLHRKYLGPICKIFMSGNLQEYDQFMARELTEDMLKLRSLKFAVFARAPAARRRWALL